MEQKNLMNSTYRKKIDVIQNNVSSEIQTENNIAKVICASAKANIDSFETLKGEIRMSGNVCFMVTYVNEMGEFFTIKSNEPFQTKVENELITVNDVPVFKTEVIELKINNVSSEEVKLNALVETTVDAFVSDSVNLFVNNNENIITNSNFVNFSQLVSHDNLTFNFEEQFDIKEKVNKVLFTNASVVITDYSLGTDYFTVEGLITVNMGYETGEEEKEFNQVIKTFKFKEELEKDGIDKEGNLVLTATINNCDITTNISEDKVSFTAPVKVHYYYLKTNCQEVVVDAFSLKNKLNLNIETFKINCSSLMKSFCERIDGQLVLDDDKPRILKLMGHCGENASITKSFVENGKLITEGVASVNVVYLEEDETEVLNSVNVEIPFSLETACEELTDNMDITTSVNITDVNVKTKKGKEINLDLELYLTTNAFSTCEEMALTEVVEGEPLTPKEACLQIYFAKKGSSLWDISKGIQCKPEQVLNQNPNLTLPLENDEKIVYFEQNE